MTIELVPVRPEHLRDLARICHRAFNTLHTRHAVHPDVPSEEVGAAIIGALLHRPDCAGVAALDGGRVVGSNFLLLADEVCGVGPITVEPGVQSRGTGRALMQWVIDEARRRRGERAQVRLYQEAVNTASLSLYTSVGFTWRDAAALMIPSPAESEDASVRPLTESDLPDVARLSTRHYGHSRVNDAARLLRAEVPGLVRERGGRVTGYQFSTLYGHGAAESNGDLLALAAQSARRVPEPLSVVLVPMSQPALFRAALAAGFRTAKVMNLMSLETFDQPPGPAFPSILC